MQRTPVKDINHALALNSPSGATLRAYMGDELTAVTIAKICLEAAELINVKGSISLKQAQKVAEFVLRDYYFLKLSELKHAFENGAIGQYGKSYDRMDVEVVMDWVRQYNEERMAHVEAERIKQHQTIKKNPPISSNEAANNFKRMAEIMRSAIKTPPPAPEVPQIDQEERQRNLAAYKAQMMDEAKRREELKALGMMKNDEI